MKKHPETLKIELVKMNSNGGQKKKTCQEYADIYTDSLWIINKIEAVHINLNTTEILCHKFHINCFLDIQKKPNLI